MAIAMMGMHRSGTSLTARLLNLAGLYLGHDEELMPADLHNSKGYWEHRPLLELNDQILAHFGGTWDCPPTLETDSLAAPALEPLRTKARAILETSFDAHTIWGWKDPRTSLTLPFWEGVIDEPVRTVLCVRNPLAVTASMQAAGFMPLAHGLALWQFYYERALLNTRPESRVIVVYQDILDDSIQALAPALELASLPLLVPGSERARAVDAFVDAGMRHQHFTPRDVQNHPEVPDETRCLFALLREHPDEATEFARSRQTAQNARFFQMQNRIYGLQVENHHMKNILGGPAHRIVSGVVAKTRRLDGFHRTVANLLRGVAGTH